MLTFLNEKQKNVLSMDDDFVGLDSTTYSLTHSHSDDDADDDDEDHHPLGTGPHLLTVKYCPLLTILTLFF